MQLAYVTSSKFLAPCENAHSHNPKPPKLPRMENHEIVLAPHVEAGEIELLRRAENFDTARHPVLVYLASLSPGSRRTMKGALNCLAALLTGGRCDALALDWSLVRFSHGAALRAVLAERYAPATANKMLAAWRGVLKVAWRLELLSSEDYGRGAR